MISVVIPFFNEEENVQPLYSELAAVLKGLKEGYEILFVDDGSTDKTFARLSEIKKKDNNVKVLRLRKHLGKSFALSVAFQNAKGETVIQMDGDLQDDPAEIPKFLEALKGSDLVVGWKFPRKDKFGKRFASKIFNSLACMMFGMKLHDINCGFKAYRKAVIENIKLYGELHRYVPMLASDKGFSVSEVKVNHRPRAHGKTKYGVFRLPKGFFDLLTVKFLTSYSSSPLYFFGTIGMLFMLVGFVPAVYLVLERLKGLAIGNRPLLLFSVFSMLLGIQIITLGILGELVVKDREPDIAYSWG